MNIHKAQSHWNIMQHCGWEKAVGTRPEQFGWGSTKKSHFQVDFHPTLLIKAAFSTQQAAFIAAQNLLV